MLIKNNIEKENSKQELVFGQDLLVFLLFYFGVAAIFDYFVNIKIGGVSLFVTIITYFIVFYVFVRNCKVINKYHLFFYYIISVILFLILILRSFFYGENFVNLVGVNRFIFFVPIVLMLCNKMNFGKVSDKFIRFSLYLVLIIHTLNSVLYFVGFPSIEHVDVLADDYVEFSRFGGIMGGANVQAVFTSTIYMILILSNLKLSIAKFLLITIGAILAIVPTVSRGGMIIILMTALYFLYIKLKEGTLLDRASILFVVLLILVVIATQIDFSSLQIFYASFFNRFDSDDLSSGRWDRLIYFWRIINDNYACYLIGVPAAIQETGTKTISDNVFTLLPVNFGMIFTFIFLIFMYILSDKQKNNLNIKLYFVVIFIISFTNNSIIWTAWTYYVILGFFYLKYKNINVDNKTVL